MFDNPSELEALVTTVKNLKQAGASESEMDAFILDAADIIFIYDEEPHKKQIEHNEELGIIPPRGTYLLAGIDVLREAVDVGLLKMDSEFSNGQPGVRYQQ